jgi:hypothetical protein
MALFVFILKFIMGWILFIVLFLVSLFYSLLFWNWRETFTLDMQVVITEIAGKSVYEAMSVFMDE